MKLIEVLAIFLNSKVNSQMRWSYSHYTLCLHHLHHFHYLYSSYYLHYLHYLYYLY